VDRASLPWRRPESLGALAAAWHQRLSGRLTTRVGGGPGWLRLTLEAPQESAPPAQIFLLARAGAVMAWDDAAPLPRAWTDALGWVPQKRLAAAQLLGCRLRSVSTPAEDAILFLDFTDPDGTQFVLAHQLFGQRGNLVLADDGGRRLWSAHASPHPATLAPPPTPSSAPPAGSDPDAVAAQCRDLGPSLLGPVLLDEAFTEARTALRRVTEAAHRLAENLARDLATADGGEAVRHCAETLAIHLHGVRRGAAAVELPDAAGEPCRIVLDPTLSPAENLDRLFQRARKAARGREHIARRLAEAQAKQQLCRDLQLELDGLAGADDPLAAVLAWRAGKAPLLGSGKRIVAGRREAPPEAQPYRRFLVDERWEVWIGRNDRENDELTHKAAASDDWWLHAQGVPGSHVVLRAGGRPEQVPGSVLEKAASLAAQYCRARNSGLVPVVYTLRKHVRKPRRSPPGLAACTHEKSLLVPPGVMPGVVPLNAGDTGEPRP
jgi:predicted ribosome quality control (RQC) complex YloA/Tae2 family protein